MYDDKFQKFWYGGYAAKKNQDRLLTSCSLLDILFPSGGGWLVLRSVL